MENIKAAFNALPHVNEVWVTRDGNFHLHPDHGGEKISREDMEDIEDLDDLEGLNDMKDLEDHTDIKSDELKELEEIDEMAGAENTEDVIEEIKPIVAKPGRKKKVSVE